MGGVALAQTTGSIIQDDPPYPSQYWILGSLQKDPADMACPEPTGYQIVFYSTSGDPLQGYATAYADANGKFYINCFDDLRLNLAPGTNNFYIGVVKKDDYGVNEQQISIPDVGWTSVTLTLKKGEGIDPLTEEDGQIINTHISRETDVKGSGLVITWEIGPNGDAAGVAAVNIWGSPPGSGKDYDKAVAWSKVNPAPISGSPGSFKVTSITVRDGNNVFFRVVSAETSAADIHNETLNNYAVGKVEVPLFKSATGLKYTRFSAPLLQRSSKWEDVIGDQLTPDTTPAEADQILRWTGTGWGSLYYQSAAAGYAVNSGAAFDFVFGEGYALRVPDRSGQANDVVSVVGRVKKDTFRIADTFKNLALTKYAIFAHPFPVTLALDNAGFRESGAYKSDTPASADQILKWDGTGWVSMYLSNASAKPYWKPLGASSFQLVPAIGYTYRKGDGNTDTDGYNWTLSP